MSTQHHRVTEQGKALGKSMSRLADLGARRLAELDVGGPMNLPGMRDERCASCAFTIGTVPNGCLQTQLDVMKAVIEGERFCCHAPRDGRMCAGYIAARAEHTARPMPAKVAALAAKWEFSPPDAEPTA